MMSAPVRAMPSSRPMTTLVLLPGLLCDDTVWTHQRAVLPADECIVPSFEALDSIGAMAEQVLATVAAPRFSLAGHSMGGRVALEVLRRAPQRVERLALLDTGIDPIAPGADGEREREARMALLAMARREGMRAMGRQWARGMVHPSRLESAVFTQILDMIERRTPDIFAAQIAALLGRPDAREVLRSLRCDTLLLCGRDDAWSPLARHAQMHSLLPAARLAVIEHCGHMSTMEQPEAVSEVLAQWLRRPLSTAR
jgi:pimeloyl-ACP methyl ester carboxylesterase